MLVAKYFYTPASEDQMHIQRYLSANCSGDHVARRGIHISTRELLTPSMLVSLGGRDPQVKAHIRKSDRRSGQLEWSHHRSLSLAY
jgi:4-carboxymuconolactone decarboxylase